MSNPTNLQRYNSISGWKLKFSNNKKEVYNKLLFQAAQGQQVSGNDTKKAEVLANLIKFRFHKAQGYKSGSQDETKLENSLSEVKKSLALYNDAHPDSELNSTEIFAFAKNKNYFGRADIPRHLSDNLRALFNSNDNDAINSFLNALGDDVEGKKDILNFLSENGLTINRANGNINPSEASNKPLINKLTQAIAKKISSTVPYNKDTVNLLVGELGQIHTNLYNNQSINLSLKFENNVTYENANDVDARNTAISQVKKIVTEMLNDKNIIKDLRQLSKSDVAILGKNISDYQFADNYINENQQIVKNFNDEVEKTNTDNQNTLDTSKTKDTKNEAAGVPTTVEVNGIKESPEEIATKLLADINATNTNLLALYDKASASLAAQETALKNTHDVLKTDLSDKMTDVAKQIIDIDNYINAINGASDANKMILGTNHDLSEMHQHFVDIMTSYADKRKELVKFQRQLQNCFDALTEKNPSEEAPNEKIADLLKAQKTVASAKKAVEDLKLKHAAYLTQAQTVSQDKSLEQEYRKALAESLKELKQKETDITSQIETINQNNTTIQELKPIATILLNEFKESFDNIIDFLLKRVNDDVAKELKNMEESLTVRWNQLKITDKMSALEVPISDRDSTMSFIQRWNHYLTNCKKIGEALNITVRKLAEVLNKGDKERFSAENQKALFALLSTPQLNNESTDERIKSINQLIHSYEEIQQTQAEIKFYAENTYDQILENFKKSEGDGSPNLKKLFFKFLDDFEATASEATGAQVKFKTLRDKITNYRPTPKEDMLDVVIDTLEELSASYNRKSKLADLNSKLPTMEAEFLAQSQSLVDMIKNTTTGLISAAGAKGSSGLGQEEVKQLQKTVEVNKTEVDNKYKPKTGISAWLSKPVDKVAHGIELITTTLKLVGNVSAQASRHADTGFAILSAQLDKLQFASSGFIPTEITNEDLIQMKLKAITITI